jgi:hypothetical protein
MPSRLPVHNLDPGSHGTDEVIKISGGKAIWGSMPTDPEFIRDTIGATLVQGTGITITVNDAGDTITITKNPAVRSALFKIPGVLALSTGATRLYNDTGSTWTIVSVRASVETSPTGASIKVDVNKNGTTIFTTQANRPTIAIGGTTSGKVTNADVTSVADGDFITVDVDQVGSTVAGSDLTLTLVVSYA